MGSGIVWINWEEYTGLQMAFYGVGCALWVVTYVVYIRNIFKFHYIEMPVFAGCCDVAWEFVWSFLAANNMGMLFQSANVVWFFLDATIIFSYGVLMFGWKQFKSPTLTPRHIYIPMCLAIAVGCGMATYFFHAQGFENAVGGRIAYLIQLSISFLYVQLMLGQADLRNFSWTANWTRALGSALVVVFFYLKFPNDYFLLTIGTSSAIIDATFIYLYLSRRAELRRVSSPDQIAQGALGLP